MKAKTTRHADIELDMIIFKFIRSLEKKVPTLEASSLYDLESRQIRNEETPTFMGILHTWRNLCPEVLITGSTVSLAMSDRKLTDLPPKDCVCGKPQ